MKYYSELCIRPPSTQRKKMDRRIIVYHNYTIGHMWSDYNYEERLNCQIMQVDRWKVGRRVIEFDCPLSGLKFCQSCLLGPVPLTYDSMVRELKKRLWYLYVMCSNTDYWYINKVAYGKTSIIRKGDMPSFSVNTKLGTGKSFTFIVHRVYSVLNVFSYASPYIG